MTAPSAEFAAQVAEAIQAERAARIDNLGLEATLWLAAAPLWTMSAATAASFPAPDGIGLRQAGQGRGLVRDPRLAARRRRRANCSSGCPMNIGALSWTCCARSFGWRGG